MHYALFNRAVSQVSHRHIASALQPGRHASADVIERCLAHVSANAVRAAYNRHAYRKERRAMLQQWADHLDLLHKKHGKSAALPPALRTTHRKTHHSSQNRRSRRSQRKAA